MANETLDVALNLTGNSSLNQTLNESTKQIANLINKSLSGLANQTGNHLVQNAASGFIPTLAQRFWDIVSAPIRIPGMLWIVVPLVAALLMMEFYFSRYTKEELGWNTAVGNSLVLIFVSIDLLRHIYGDTNFFALDITQLLVVKKTLIALAVALGAFLLLFTEFFHWLPKKFAFFVSSSLPVNLIAYLSIILVYSDIPLDIHTLLSGVVMFVLLLLVFKLVYLVVPAADNQEVEETKRYDYDKNGLTEVKE